ncbi:sulfur carrier protein ThiS [Gaiella occulta]|uniref:sulfur carrier protein ThiS n=1 Tax=Gaiella occulta TaxID=1002870 RepID=UPI001C68C247|nr:sulfur carrier protein ThiS [Gaiella occulta]
MTQIEIVLNGSPFQLSAGQSVTDLVRVLGLPGDGRGVAVALDGEVLARSAWSSVRLEPGRRVEIVVATQGG